METITKTTDYVLFKPSNVDGYDYVRISNNITDTVDWSIGHKNSFGGVSLFGGSLIASKIKELESEYQECVILKK